jgi:hypothetical protein
MRTVDERRPGIESRRRSDCFPDGGAVCITIGTFTLLAFAFGVAIGAWWF